MIQAIRMTNFNAYLSTMDNTRLDSGESRGQIRYLVKFINDLDGSVYYCYPLVNKGGESYIWDRYTRMEFYYNPTPDMFAGQLDLPIAGHYKYEVYEVKWVEGDTVTLDAEHAPTTESQPQLPYLDEDDMGAFYGLVTKGILNLSEVEGLEEVQYTQNAKSVQDITLTWGGESYTTVTTIIFKGDCITPATATCTIETPVPAGGGVVTSITLTSGGSGYTSNPQIGFDGGTTSDNIARATANIEQTNYIYTG